MAAEEADSEEAIIPEEGIGHIGEEAEACTVVEEAINLTIDGANRPILLLEGRETQINSVALVLVNGFKTQSCP